MPVLQENDTGKANVNNANRLNSRKNDKVKKKKQARWSLGKDSKGRRISFGFRDENTESNFTTPTREALRNRKKNDGDNDEDQKASKLDSLLDNIEINDFEDIDDNDFENTANNNNRNTQLSNKNNYNETIKTPNTAMKKKILMTLQEAKNVDFYKLLGLTKNASPTEIKRAFHKLSFTYHPDKAGRNNVEDVGVEITSPEDTTAMFTLINKAHAVLSDPVERATYDMVEGFQESTEENLEKINKTNKENAERDVNLMKNTYELIVERERKTKGIIIKEARYGAIPSYVKKDQSIEYQCAHLPTIDVKIPVQCKVNESSKLYINSGESKRFCSGFYDPIGESFSNTERSLIVRYKFRGKMHQVIVGDKASLQMPLKAHIYNKKVANYSKKKRRRSDRRQNRKKSSLDNTTDLCNEEGNEVKVENRVLTEEQLKLKNQRIVMITMLSFISSVAGLVSFSQSYKDGNTRRK